MLLKRGWFHANVKFGFPYIITYLSIYLLKKKNPTGLHDHEVDSIIGNIGGANYKFQIPKGSKGGIRVGWLITKTNFQTGALLERGEGGGG